MPFRRGITPDRGLTQYGLLTFINHLLNGMILRAGICIFWPLFRGLGDDGG